MQTRYHVGRTVASEGNLKLPDFEPEVYADIFIRHFMRFALRTTSTSSMHARICLNYI